MGAKPRMKLKSFVSDPRTLCLLPACSKLHLQGTLHSCQQPDGSKRSPWWILHPQTMAFTPIISSPEQLKQLLPWSHAITALKSIVFEIWPTQCRVCHFPTVWLCVPFLTSLSSNFITWEIRRITVPFQNVSFNILEAQMPHVTHCKQTISMASSHTQCHTLFPM